MKKTKIILTLSSIVASSTIIAPIIPLTTSCSCSTNEPKFVLMKTTDGYIIDGLQNEDRSTITSIEVPSTINGKKVVSISKGAFKGCISLQSITLPFIGQSADATGFNGLFGYIFGDEMYEGCGQYTWQTFSESNEYGVEPTDYINYAIPKSLQTVTIKGATRIPTGAFSACSKLKTIKFVDCTATEIGNLAFYKCVGLKEFEIPTSIKTIGREAFTYCCNIKSMELPSSVIEVKHNAFKSCLSLTSCKIPTSVTTMGKQIFQNMSSGLIMVEALSKPSGWDEEWILKNQSVVYDYHKGGIFYTNTCQVALCGDSEKYAYVIQLLEESTGDELTLDSEVSVNGVMYPIKKIGQGVFSGYTTVKKVVLPSKLEVIGANCFYGCNELETVSFPSTLKTIGYCAFQGTKISKTYNADTNAVEDGIVLQNVETIENNAFQNCTSLTNINFGNSLQSIGDYAFDGCLSLVHLRTNATTQNKILTFPKSIKSIGSYAFRDTAKLVSSEITDSTVYGDIQFEAGNTNQITIGENAFENMGVKSLTDTYKKYIRMCFDFKDANLTEIPNAMFKNSTLQRLVNLPSKIEKVGEYAFYSAGITYTDPIKTTTDVRTVKLPKVKTLAQYSFYGNGSCNFDITGNTVLTTIGNAALAYCSYADFKSLPLPNTVESIGASAFVGCNKLETINIPSKITRLESSTFNGCTSLWSGVDTVEIPSNITYLGNSCFNNCQSLKNIKIWGFVTTIGSNCFSNCSNLLTIWYKDNFDSITSMGSSIYQNCTKLTTDSGHKIYPDDTCIQKNLTQITPYVFDGCKGLTDEYAVSTRYTSIGNSAFRGCTGLTKISGMGSIKAIYQNAFTGCTGLTSIAIPAGCNTIGEYAFANCTNISSIELPVDITMSWDATKSKGMGLLPFYNWTSDQIIYFKDANLTKTYDETKEEIETWWGWKLKRQGTAGSYYYTCDDSGGNAKFKFKQ